MKLSLCTISFRHQLVAISDIAAWAKINQFQGIELWGIHAINLANQSRYCAEWLAEYQLYVSMLSDYLPLEGPDDVAYDKVDKLCALARNWGTTKLRTFAGHRASAEVNGADRKAMTQRLRNLCERAQDQGIRLVVETHPGTLADTIESTQRLFAEVNHPALRLNFDVLHVWEAGDPVWDSYYQLQPFIDHMHLKNIGHRDQLPVFAPGNVYSPAGCREGMVSVFEGAFDYAAFLQQLVGLQGEQAMQQEASLEWFGQEVLETLNQDVQKIREFIPAPQMDSVRSKSYQHPQLGLVG